MKAAASPGLAKGNNSSPGAGDLTRRPTHGPAGISKLRLSWAIGRRAQTDGAMVTLLLITLRLEASTDQCSITMRVRTRTDGALGPARVARPYRTLSYPMPAHGPLWAAAGAMPWARQHGVLTCSSTGGPGVAVRSYRHLPLRPPPPHPLRFFLRAPACSRTGIPRVNASRRPKSVLN